MERLAPYIAAIPQGSWETWIKQAYFDRVSLSSTGYYRLAARMGSNSVVIRFLFKHPLFWFLPFTNSTIALRTAGLRIWATTGRRTRASCGRTFPPEPPARKWRSTVSPAVTRSDLMSSLWLLVLILKHLRWTKTVSIFEAEFSNARWRDASRSADRS